MSIYTKYSVPKKILIVCNLKTSTSLLLTAGKTVSKLLCYTGNLFMEKGC